METLADKLAMAGHYALLQSHEVTRRGYSIVPPFKLDFTTIYLFYQDHGIWMAGFDGLGWAARIGPVDDFFNRNWWRGYAGDGKE